MAAAGKGDGGPRGGAPAAPESAAPESRAPESRAPEFPALGSPGDAMPDASVISSEEAVTQLLPIVTRYAPAVEPTVVRAVARRAAAALPSLGREGLDADIAHSARSTATRRRAAAQGVKASATDPKPAAAVPGPGAPPAAVPGRGGGAGSALRDDAAPNGGTSGTSGEPAHTRPKAPAEPGVTVHPETPTRRPAPAGGRHAVPADSDGTPPGAARARAETGSAGSALLLGQPAAMPARPGVVGGALAAEMVSALTEVAFREARTDEWIVTEPSPDQRALPAVPAVRTGPRVLDADSWDTAVQPAVEQDSYRGRQRAGRPSNRVWLVVGLVVLVLGAAITVPFLLTTQTAPPGAASSPQAVIPPELDDGEVISGTSSPGAAPTTGNASGLPAVGASPLVTASPPPSAVESPNAASGAGRLLAIEAEAPQNTLSGTAARASYPNTSGGQLVGYLGKVDLRPPGTLTFTNVTVPSDGTYTLRFFYIANANRTAVISVNGGAPISVNTPARTDCCGTRDVQLTLDTRTGGNSITFGNPNARCPAIDKIEIIRP